MQCAWLGRVHATTTNNWGNNMLYLWLKYKLRSCSTLLGQQPAVLKVTTHEAGDQLQLQGEIQVLPNIEKLLSIHRGPLIFLGSRHPMIILVSSECGVFVVIVTRPKQVSLGKATWKCHSKLSCQNLKHYVESNCHKEAIAHKDHSHVG